MLTRSKQVSKVGQYIPKSIKPIFINLIVALQKLEIRYRSIFAREHLNPVFILGNQKSGTSAITALLGYLTNTSVSVDLTFEYLSSENIYSQVYRGEKKFSELVKQNRYDFSSKIIKEANLTGFYPELCNHFPASKFVFVVRNPKDNIRSILNRLNLPGDLQDLTQNQKGKIPLGWSPVFDSKWLKISGNTYIEILAERWNHFSDIYFQNQQNIILVKYEDFLINKVGEIQRLGNALALETKNDISDKIDVQYQPKGQRSVRLDAFFGLDNLSKIDEICKHNMLLFKYI